MDPSKSRFKAVLSFLLTFVFRRCFIGTRDPGDLIIMEDLCVVGYRAANRLVGLDFEHIQLAIATLAKMHAASAVFVEKVRD